ncbi:rubrerythrin [Arthrobacter sp. TE12231]
MSTEPIEGPVLPTDLPGRTKRSLVVGAVVLVAALIGGGAWWFGSALPAQQEVQAQASSQAAAQTAKDAAAKKKADDSAAFWAKVDADNKARSEQNAKDVAAFNSSQEADRAADVQRQMEAQGWKRYSDVLYYQYAADSEFTCGHFSCTYIHVTTLAPNGCPGGMYVAASIEKGHASIGLTNDITAPLTKGKDAIVQLQDISNQGDGFQLTTMNCHGG